MAVETDAMRSEFLADWGSTATYGDTSAGSTASVTAMLKREYYEETAGDATVQSSSPVAHVRTSDVSSVVQGDTLAIDSVTYTIVEVSPDNEGITQLRLRV
mgnify:FL=1